MKKNSYPFLFMVTILILSTAFLFFWWKAAIYRVTYLSPQASRYFILFCLISSFTISMFLLRKGALKDGRLSSYLKLFGGLSIVLGLFAIIPIITIVFLIPGEQTFYTAPYSYAVGGYRSCSGAEVVDPDLGTSIRICYPEGDYEHDKLIYIEKRSNALGMVVTFAITTPQ